MSKTLPTDGFIRDDNSGAIINTDKEAMKAYKLRRSLEISKQNEINKLREEMSDIKDMLKQLLEKNDT